MAGLKYLLFSILAIISVSSCIKINMQGSVSLGKDVMDSLTHYMRSHRGMAFKSRRSGTGTLQSLGFDQGTERIKWTYESVDVGKDVKVYNTSAGFLIKEYILVLANGIENILNGILTHKDEEPAGFFVEYLKPILIDIHDILKDADVKIREDKDLIDWLAVLKKITARYQKGAISFSEEKLDGDPHDISDVKRKIIQKIMIAIALVENKYENKLCRELHICDKTYLVTKTLNALLSDFKIHDNEKAQEFVKYFYESLPENLFYFLHMDTTQEFQVILSDLSYTKHAPTKELLLSVQRAVEARLNLLKKDVELPNKAYDQHLVNVILSDFDYFYHVPKKSHAFDKFIAQFIKWQKSGGKLRHPMRSVIKDIGEKLSKEPPVLVEKLTNQIRIFLELTVDPEK